jgi:hypothetical protein
MESETNFAVRLPTAEKEELKKKERERRKWER